MIFPPPGSFECRREEADLSACQGKPPDELLLAIAQFNSGDWFECHETLEELWVGAKGELRDFYQGVLQLAVALYHWRNGNFRGAVILLKGGCTHLHRVPPICLGVEVCGLIARAGEARAALTALGEERMSELPAELIPKIDVLAKCHSRRVPERESSL